MTAPFQLDVLGPDHFREGFQCGVTALDHYLLKQANQDVRRRVSVCYVATESASGKIAGFYTLAAASVPLLDLPDSVTKKLPRYPSVPVARIGRLAIDLRFQGQKLGAALLADAAMRSARSELAVFALLVDAKDEPAANFYRHHGFEPFAGRALQLFMPMERFKRTAINLGR